MNTENKTSDSAVFDLACKLISKKSISPEDGACQELLIQRLKAIGFDCETIRSQSVTNLWARRGTTAPLFVFAGHTDVVPTGPLDQWHSDPFVPTVREGKLYGRGASDMKSSLAAMLVAAERFIQTNPEHKGSIAFLITSDEEDIALDGTKIVCQQLQARNERPDYCLVGEPTCVNQLGDMMKNGRRGTLSARMTVFGIQAHIAYPHLGKNPIHLIAPALNELVAHHWDHGNEFYAPTSFQISNIHAGTGANNVIPGHLQIDFNFRFAPTSTAEQLKQQVHDILDRAGLEYKIDWHLGGEPFFTAPGRLSEVLSQAILQHTGVNAELSTSGGTSDGRFIAKICPEVIEFGPPNASIHKINEHIAVADLEPLAKIYQTVLASLLA